MALRNIDEASGLDLIVGAPQDPEITWDSSNSFYETAGSHHSPEVLTGQAYFYSGMGALGSSTEAFDISAMSQTANHAEDSEFGYDVTGGILLNRSNTLADAVIGAPASKGDVDADPSGNVFIFEGADDPFSTGSFIDPYLDPATSAELLRPADDGLCETTGDRYGAVLEVGFLDSSEAWLAVGAPLKAAESGGCTSSPSDDRGGVYLYGPAASSPAIALTELFGSLHSGQTSSSDELGTAITFTAHHDWDWEFGGLKADAATGLTYTNGQRSLWLGAPGHDRDLTSMVVRSGLVTQVEPDSTASWVTTYYIGQE